MVIINFFDFSIFLGVDKINHRMPFQYLKKNDKILKELTQIKKTISDIIIVWTYSTFTLTLKPLLTKHNCNKLLPKAKLHNIQYIVETTTY